MNNTQEPTNLEQSPSHGMIEVKDLAKIYHLGTVEVPALCGVSFQINRGEVVAIMGASPGMLGTARAQYHLRQSFVFLGCFALNRPEVMVPFAQEKIDRDGKVTDQKTREKIRELIESLVAWTKKLKGEL